MLKVGGQVNVDSVDVRPFVATLPALLTGWRQLRFDEGRGLHPATGQRWAGLQAVSGSHPYPGAVYRLAFRRERAPAPTSPEPSEDKEPSRDEDPTETTYRIVLVELLADDSTRTRFSVRDDAGGGWAEVEIERPHLPGAVDVAIELPGPADWIWLARGRVAGQVRLTTDRLLSIEGTEPQLVATVTHPRAQARGEARVAAASDGMWTVSTTIEAGGRGLLRPVAWLLTPFLRGYAQRWLDAFLTRLPRSAKEMKHGMNTEFRGSPDPEWLAARGIEDLFEALAKSLPPELDDGSPGRVPATRH